MTYSRGAAIGVGSSARHTETRSDAGVAGEIGAAGVVGTAELIRTAAHRATIVEAHDRRRRALSALTVVGTGAAHLIRGAAHRADVVAS